METTTYQVHPEVPDWGKVIRLATLAGFEQQGRRVDDLLGGYRPLSRFPHARELMSEVLLFRKGITGTLDCLLGGSSPETLVRQPRHLLMLLRGLSPDQVPVAIHRGFMIDPLEVPLDRGFFGRFITAFDLWMEQQKPSPILYDGDVISFLRKEHHR